MKILKGAKDPGLPRKSETRLFPFPENKKGFQGASTCSRTKVLKFEHDLSVKDLPVPEAVFFPPVGCGPGRALNLSWPDKLICGFLLAIFTSGAFRDFFTNYGASFYRLGPKNGLLWFWVESLKSTNSKMLDFGPLNPVSVSK